MEKQHGDKATAQNPENPAFRSEGVQQCLQEMGVMVEICGAGIDLEVADHMKEDKTHHGYARDTHYVLLAHCGGIEVEEKRTLLALLGGGPGDRAPLRCNYLCHVNKLSLRAGRADCAIALETVARESPEGTT